MIPGISCATCVFFSPPPFQSRFAGQQASGQCRRHAPALDFNERGPRTLWPLVRADAWCGEHSTIDAE